MTARSFRCVRCCACGASAGDGWGPLPAGWRVQGANAAPYADPRDPVFAMLVCSDACARTADAIEVMDALFRREIARTPRRAELAMSLPAGVELDAFGRCCVILGRLEVTRAGDDLLIRDTLTTGYGPLPSVRVARAGLQ